MSNINHIAGGIVLTGIFTSFWDINVLSKTWYLITCIFFSLFPDIDHPKRRVVAKAGVMETPSWSPSPSGIKTTQDFVIVFSCGAVRLEDDCDGHVGSPRKSWSTI